MNLIHLFNTNLTHNREFMNSIYINSTGERFYGLKDYKLFTWTIDNPPEIISANNDKIYYIQHVIYADILIVCSYKPMTYIFDISTYPPKLIKSIGGNTIDKTNWLFPRNIRYSLDGIKYLFIDNKLLYDTELETFRYHNLDSVNIKLSKNSLFTYEKDKSIIKKYDITPELDLVFKTNYAISNNIQDYLIIDDKILTITSDHSLTVINIYGGSKKLLNVYPGIVRSPLSINNILRLGNKLYYFATNLSTLDYDGDVLYGKFIDLLGNSADKVFTLGYTGNLNKPFIDNYIIVGNRLIEINSFGMAKIYLITNDI